VVLTLPILVGTDGHMRMSKTTGNYIGIDEPPEDVYGKVMSIPDEIMLNYYTLITRFGPDEVAAVERGLADGSLHPMEAKKKLACELVSRYHGDEAAARAEARFAQVFQQREVPSEMPTYRPERAVVNVIDLVVGAGLAPSKSQARRLVAQGGVRLDGIKIEDVGQMVEVREGSVLQVGRRGFVKLEKVT
jgi:tyrosyl-tRNA synthetase